MLLGVYLRTLRCQHHHSVTRNRTVLLRSSNKQVRRWNASRRCLSADGFSWRRQESYRSDNMGVCRGVCVWGGGAIRELQHGAVVQDTIPQHYVYMYGTWYSKVCRECVYRALTF